MTQRILAISLLALFISNANADESLCQASYVGGMAPKILKTAISQKTQEICYEGYATQFSGVTRTPLWSADHLTKDRVANACTMKRHDAFHSDPNLSVDLRSELSDYARSGYDRGHMAPSADMPDLSSQTESFSLANMAPQLHANNAGIWEKLENGSRNLALSGHDVYMVSGPLFEGSKIKQLKKRVMVPTGFFKAIYDATSKQVGVYVTPNTAENTFTLISADDLAERVGIDIYPMLSSEEKSKAAQVISPAQRTNCGRRKKQ
jgi:endonuclease G